MNIQKFIQTIARMTYRAFVVAMIFYMTMPDQKGIYFFPVGIIIGLCSEADEITKKY